MKYYDGKVGDGEAEQTPGKTDVHVSTKDANPYEEFLLLTLVELNTTIQGLALLISEGRFKPFHMEMFRKKVEFVFGQLDLMAKHYGTE